MGFDELLKSKAELHRVALAHGARNVRVFGSFVRGTAGPESDVDFLVEFEPGRTLLDLMALMREFVRGKMKRNTGRNCPEAAATSSRSG